MQTFQDNTFLSETVEIDDKRFIRCKFEHCTVVWSGRHAAFDGTSFTLDTEFVFHGVAGRVVDLLNMLGMIKPVYAVRSSAEN